MFSKPNTRQNPKKKKIILQHRDGFREPSGDASKRLIFKQKTIRVSLDTGSSGDLLFIIEKGTQKYIPTLKSLKYQAQYPSVINTAHYISHQYSYRGVNHDGLPPLRMKQFCNVRKSASHSPQATRPDQTAANITSAQCAEATDERDRSSGNGWGSIKRAEAGGSDSACIVVES